MSELFIFLTGKITDVVDCFSYFKFTIDTGHSFCEI